MSHRFLKRIEGSEIGHYYYPGIEEQEEGGADRTLKRQQADIAVTIGFNIKI